MASYTAKSLRALVESAGFRLRTARTLHGVAPWLAPLSVDLARRAAERAQNRAARFGCILLQSFEKPAREPSA